MWYLEVVIVGNKSPSLWYSCKDSLVENELQYHFIKVPLRSKTVWAFVQNQIQVLPQVSFDLKSIQKVYEYKTSLIWVQLLQWMSDYYYCLLGVVLGSAFPKTAFEVLISPDKVKPLAKSVKVVLPPPLTQEQKTCYQTMNPNLHQFSPYLLKGVTGSGKTRFYLELILNVLKQKKSVLFLLPEIAIVKQSMVYLAQYVSVPICCIHSSESKPKVKQAWNAVFKKQQMILFGVRSAVLTPIENVGLVIVDEEHDNSYKQSDKLPRYQAKNIAVYRAKQWNCPVILGSATPSLESYFLAQNKKYKLLELTQRFNQQTLPQIHLVDMKKQLEIQGNQPLSIPLRDALQETLNRKEQVILLVNRRGYAKKRLCLNCECIEECINCACALVPHKEAQKMICHHCLYERSFEFQCQYCSQTDFLQVGLAIEFMEEKLNQYFPEATITRLDRDSVTTEKQLETIFSQVNNQTIDVLLGTQMVAKSHNFEKVSLVGVIDADSSLGLVDFRRYESIFQLLVQVAGRAGRFEKKGKVFIQTFQPKEPIFELIKNQDYELFYQQELRKRKSWFYPPYSRLFKIEFLATKEDVVWNSIQQFCPVFKKYTNKINVELLGPGFASLKKKQRKYRCQIFGKVSTTQTKSIQWALRKTLAEYSKPASVEIIIDMDVVSIV